MDEYRATSLVVLIGSGQGVGFDDLGMTSNRAMCLYSVCRHVNVCEKRLRLSSNGYRSRLKEMHEWFETQLETFNSDNVMKILAVG